MHRAARLIFLLLLLLAAGARAHPILQNPVWIESGKDGLTIKLDVSVRELIVVQGLPQPAEGLVDLDEAIERADRHTGYLLDHFQVKGDGVLLKGAITNVVPPKVIGKGLEGPDNAHFRYTIDYTFAAVPAVLTFSQNMCVEFPSAPGVPWDLSYAYRYGPRGETPRKFGPLRRDQELSFTTGFVRVRTTMPGTWFALWIVFVVAMALGGTMRTLWFKVAGVLWLASYLTAHVVLEGPPLWLIELLAGAATVLTAVDAIHGHAAASASATRPRIVLLLAGAILFGIGLSSEQPAMMQGSRMWMVLVPVCAAAAAGATWGLKSLAAKPGEKTRQLFVQVTALACCGAAVWLMLRLLEVI